MVKEGRTRACQRETVRTGSPFPSVSVFFQGPRYCSWYTDSLRIGMSRAQNSAGVKFSGQTRPTPRSLHASCMKGTGSPPREYSGQGLALTVHRLLGPRRVGLSSLCACWAYNGITFTLPICYRGSEFILLGIITTRMRLDEQRVHMCKQRNVCKIMVEKGGKSTTFGISRHRKEDNIKTHLKGIGWGLYSFDVTRAGGRCQCNYKLQVS